MTSPDKHCLHELQPDFDEPAHRRREVDDVLGNVDEDSRPYARTASSSSEVTRPGQAKSHSPKQSLLGVRPG